MGIMPTDEVYDMPRAYAPQASLICAQCGASFNVKAYRAERARFCSKRCHYDARTSPLAERFWSRVQKTDTCWLWTGYIDKKTGYGQISLERERRHRDAHRIAWQLATGQEPPAGFHVCHSCDVRGCVRNDEQGFYELGGVLLPRYGHLFLGTAAQNRRDCSDKGRDANVGPKGAASRHAKLTDDDVREIRRLYTTECASVGSLATRFRVHQSQISRILSGERWSHVK
jgi:hypothetical protein